MATKDAVWMGTSLEDLRLLPEDVIDVFGYAIHLAQNGEKHFKSKALKNIKAIEVIENYDGDTYRAVYTAKLKKSVYVLHCFQKKSKRGISTPKNDIDIIKKRLREAEEMEKYYD